MATAGSYKVEKSYTELIGDSSQVTSLTPPYKTELDTLYPLWEYGRWADGTPLSAQASNTASDDQAWDEAASAGQITTPTWQHSLAYTDPRNRTNKDEQDTIRDFLIRSTNNFDEIVAVAYVGKDASKKYPIAGDRIAGIALEQSGSFNTPMNDDNLKRDVITYQQHGNAAFWGIVVPDENEANKFPIVFPESVNGEITGNITSADFDIRDTRLYRIMPALQTPQGLLNIMFEANYRVEDTSVGEVSEWGGFVPRKAGSTVVHVSHPSGQDAQFSINIKGYGATGDDIPMLQNTNTLSANGTSLGANGVVNNAGASTFNNVADPIAIDIDGHELVEWAVVDDTTVQFAYPAMEPGKYTITFTFPTGESEMIQSGSVTVA